MEILNRKLVLNALVASVMVVGSQALAGPGKSKGAGGWEPSADHLESVVIAIKVDPVSGYDPDAMELRDVEDSLEALKRSAEPACVAIQIGMNLLMDTVPVGSESIAVTPADEVVLFPTVDGIELVNPANGIPFDPEWPDNPEFAANAPLNLAVCVTPNGLRSLNQLLSGFAMLGGEVLSCPLCAGPRLMGTPPNFGDVGNAETVHNLFLYADKVIDF